MATMILPMSDHGEHSAADRVQVMLHIQAEVLSPKVARRRANVWLAMHAGHLLLAGDPELVLGEPLQWRFDVLRSVPQLDRPGTASRERIGQIHLDALTGEVIDPARFLEELRANAGAHALS